MPIHIAQGLHSLHRCKKVKCLIVGLVIYSLSDLIIVPELCPSKGLVGIVVMPVENSSNGRAIGAAFDKLVFVDLIEDIEIFVERDVQVNTGHWCWLLLIQRNLYYHRRMKGILFC
jgi:hypothetical protein